MAEHIFTLNDPLAVKLWGKELAVEAAKAQYFAKFIGTGTDAMICAKTDFKKGKGDTITVPLRMNLKTYGITGDNKLEGTSAEESPKYFTDQLKIDQLRKGAIVPGKMSEQRVPINLREGARDALATWWAQVYDETIMAYLAGAIGINPNMIINADKTFTGHGENPIQAPDATHMAYAGNASSKNTLNADDKMSLSIFEKIKLIAKMTSPKITAAKIDGKEKYVMLMSPYQSFDLRNSTSQNDWLDIQKSAGERGKNNLIYQDSLGEYGGIILHEHENVMLFNDYGTDMKLNAARALLLGCQAGLIAWGGASDQTRYSWFEETEDRGNGLSITAGAIYGVKKTRFNDKDFGVIAVDTSFSQDIIQAA